MCKYLSVIFFLVLGLFSAFSQEVPESYVEMSDSLYSPVKHPVLKRNEVKQDPRIDSLLNTYVSQCKREKGIRGYRVEIYFGSSRSKALAAKTHFLSKYSDFTAYMTYRKPDFKVRVGDFRTNSEAVKLREMIRRDYPDAFIVRENIPFPELEIANVSEE